MKKTLVLGNSITMDEKRPTAEAALVKDGVFAYIGSAEEAKRLAGADAEHVQEYPGWKPNMDSAILAKSVESYRRLFGTDPEVKAIHAGLECGLFLQKFPDLDMISFGPTLRGVHAPGEKLELASLDKFVALLKDIVTTL